MVGPFVGFVAVVTGPALVVSFRVVGAFVVPFLPLPAETFARYVMPMISSNIVL